MKNVNEIFEDYKNNSKVYTINEKLKFRVPTELIPNYEKGTYNNYIEHMTNIVNKIDSLGVNYKYNAHPVFYIYMLSLDNYKDLLQIPSNFDNGTGGGRPRPCIDNDGFYRSYAITENFCNMSKEEYSDVYREASNIHELIHLVLNNKVFNPARYFSEGLSEAVPLYVFDMENDFMEHRNLITSLKEDDILTCNELYIEGDNGTFGDKKLIENKFACTYRASYVSSYLILASILDHITKEFGVSKEESVSILLDIAEKTFGNNGMFLNNITNKINMDFDTLYYKKDYQLEYINKIKSYNSNKRI